MSCEAVFIEAVRARGFRFTPQREMILRVLHHMRGHVTAEEVYTRVQALGSRVDVATVYRTLELLQELEFVNVVDTGTQGHRYELVGHNRPHSHVVCRHCGRITDLETQTLDDLRSCLHKDFGFEADVNQISIPGRCAACGPALFDVPDSQAHISA